MVKWFYYLGLVNFVDLEFVDLDGDELVEVVVVIDDG